MRGHRDRREGWAAAVTDGEQHEQDPAYERPVELAERLATEIAVSEPDWCELARDAEEFTRGARARCAANPRESA